MIASSSRIPVTLAISSSSSSSLLLLSFLLINCLQYYLTTCLAHVSMNMSKHLIGGVDPLYITFFSVKMSSPQESMGESTKMVRQHVGCTFNDDDCREIFRVRKSTFAIMSNCLRNNITKILNLGKLLQLRKRLLSHSGNLQPFTNIEQ